MNPHLMTKKKELSRTFLGRGGVHGVGIKSSAGAVKVYVHDHDEGEQSEVLAALQKAAAPFQVVVVREGQARSD